MDSAERIARLWWWIRSGAALFCVIEFTLYAFLLDDTPLPLLPLGLLIGGSLALINLAAVRFERLHPRTNRGFDRPAHRDLALLAVDTAFISGIVLLYAFDGGSTWVLLVVPVLEAGLLGRLRLALWTWGVGVVVLMSEALLASYAFGLDSDLFAAASSVFFRSGVLLMVALVVGVAAGITHRYLVLLHDAGRQMEYQATHDDLTKLPGRKLFMERARDALGGRNDGRTLAVSFIDCDRFKDVNDRYGHAAGDAVLRQVASRLRDNARSADTVARLGGDEFAALMPATTLTEAEAWASTLRRVLAEPFDIPGDEPMIVVTSTVGLAVSGAPPDDDASEALSELLGRADADMYRRKEAGRSGPRPASPLAGLAAPN